MLISTTFLVSVSSHPSFFDKEITCHCHISVVLTLALLFLPSDPDDRVYPRASSRVGTRYQAVVVKWDGPGQILVTSTIFDDPQNTLRGRARKGGRGGRPPNKFRVLEGE